LYFYTKLVTRRRTAAAGGGPTGDIVLVDG
jgi:hypothetical protein